MKNLLPLSLLLVFSFSVSCSKDSDPEVRPSNTITSTTGVLIELDWSTGGSSSQALQESDLDLYLDMNNTQVEASENLYSFESIHLKDIYKDGVYEVYVGAFDLSRRTDYSLYLSAPGSSVIHHFTGYFLAGEHGEVRYLRIRKEGNRYTLLDL